MGQENGQIFLAQSGLSTILSTYPHPKAFSSHFFLFVACGQTLYAVANRLPIFKIDNYRDGVLLRLNL